ncbi:MAG: magnesium transporter [Halobacteriaceae archaeon]
MTRLSVARESVREGLPAVAGSAAAGLVAGVLLGGMRGDFAAVPGLLVLVPAMLATRGNVYGSLGARLATGLQVGLVEPSLVPSRRVASAAVAALVSGLLVNGLAALAAAAVLPLLGEPVAGVGVLLGVALVAGLLSGVVLAVLVVGVAVLGYRRGHNPDTLVGPVVTTAGDLFGVALLALAVDLVV